MLNPLVVEGQVAGGVVAGLGGALLEHLVYDAQGQLLTTTFADYLMPTAMDVPDIEVLQMQTASPLNPLGVKGVGESGAIPPPAAVVAAVEDALAPFGIRLSATPVTPDGLRRALRAAAALDGASSPAI
jgi:carbon-monoxide dehydrogenase large subunit